jgi:hypothetical protein
MKTMTFGAFGIVLLFSGCASIVDGSNQALSIQTVHGAHQVADASCTLINNKGTWFTKTPGTVTIHRAYDDLNIKCEKDGYDAGLVTVKSSAKGMEFGNILAGGIIGAAIDMGTGAAYDYPTLITVQMGTTMTIIPTNKNGKSDLSTTTTTTFQ